MKCGQMHWHSEFLHNPSSQMIAWPPCIEGIGATATDAIRKHRFERLHAPKGRRRPNGIGGGDLKRPEIPRRLPLSS